MRLRMTTDRTYLDPESSPPVVIIGGRVFGLREIPFVNVTENTLELMAPKTLLENEHEVTVRYIFAGPTYSKSAPLTR